MKKMKTFSFLLALCFSFIGLSYAKDSYEQGLYLVALNEDGGALDSIKLEDNTAPPFRFDAHIRINDRYNNFRIGGLVWGGVLNLDTAGLYLVRVTTSVNINDRGSWRVVCESTGLISGLPIGEQQELKYYDMTGKLKERVFESQINISQPGAHKFDFRLRCRDRMTEKLNKWKFVQRHYSYVSSVVEILGPNDNAFKQLSSFDVLRKVAAPANTASVSSAATSSPATTSSASIGSNNLPFKIDTSKENIKTIQLGLHAAGFNAGAPDGDWSNATETAYSEWQQSIGEIPTGYLTAKGFAFFIQ